MNKLQQIDKKIAKLESEIDALNDERSDLMKKTFVTCCECNKRSQINAIPRIDVYIYKDELYNERHEIAATYLICPKCTATLRLDSYIPNAKVSYGKLPELYRSCGEVFKAYNDYEYHSSSFEDIKQKAIKWIEDKVK